MVECPGSNASIVMSNSETRIVSLILLLSQLLNVQTSKWYYVRRDLLLIIFVNEKCMIPQYVVTRSHYFSFVTYF